MFDSSAIETDNNAHCRVGTNFVKTSDEQVLRCYRMAGGFRITGFAQVSASTTLTMYFHLQSIQALSAEDIGVNIYGIYDDMTSPVIKKTDVVDVTHASDSAPTTLEHI